MNASTLEKRKKELHEKINAQCKQFPGMKLVIKDKKLINERDELSCIEMINSLLCYDCVGFKNAEEVMQKEEKSDFNYLKTYVEKLGRERVVELIQEQIDSIEHVESGVFVDDESVSYNSIVWKT
jgi:hypothetical protein